MAGKLKILLVEDNPADIEFIRRELRNSGLQFDFFVADSREEFVTALNTHHPDVILSDHSLPQFDSLEALSIARKFNPNLPFLLVTGTVSEEFAVMVLQQGADDYILKDHLIRLPSAIENAIKKRTAEKEREQMLEKLVRTNEELNMFLHKATHDIRGPLTSIMGLARYSLTESGLTERQEKNLRMIAESTEKLDEILLSLIQTIAVKNATVQIDDVDPARLVRNILRSLEFMPGFERIDFRIDVHTTRLFFSDEKMLLSILQNLIENSIKYQNRDLSDPFVKIDIGDAGEGIRIVIEDNGIGIPPAIQPRVFELFYRGNTASKGSGLGLYLVKYGVHRLGGTIGLSSEENRGTRITIEIPSMTANAPALN